MNIQDLIRQRAIAAGVDPDAAVAIAKIESGFDPASNQNAATRYKGLFQLGPDEWSQYGNGNIYDPTANADAFMSLYKNNVSQLAQKLGRQPTAAEAYLAHQQGVSGAGALLSNPNANAVDAIAPFYDSRKTAIAAIKGNGGDPNGTAADFVNVWNNKYAGTVGTGPAAAYQEAGSPSAATPVSTQNTQGPSTPGLLSNQVAQVANPTQMAAGLLQQSIQQQPDWEKQAPQGMIRRPQPFTGFSFLG
jgi:Transglycosylase SLT domain